MTGGLGFTKLAQALQRNHRSLLNHRDKVLSKKDELPSFRRLRKLKFKKSSKEGLEAIKNETILGEKKERRRSVFIFVLILVVALLLIFGLQ